MKHSLALWATLASLVFAATIAGCGDEGSSNGTEAGSTTTTQTETTTTEATGTLADAQKAVDGDNYASAITIATGLGATEANAIRRRIANRLSRRVLSSVRKGDLSAAKRLLGQADRYPTTSSLRKARGSYKAAKAGAAAQRAAAQQKRRDDAAAARARKEAQQVPEPSEPSTPSPPSGTCSDTPQTDFPVPPGDPRDRDGDGIACES
jgi:hypothetical protein